MTADMNVQGGTPQGMPGGEPAKKGLSRGCLIGLIVGGALLVLVVGFGLYCYANMFEFAKAGGVMAVQQVQRIVAEEPEEGIDTVMVNRVADAFVAKLETATEDDMEALAVVLQGAQAVLQDEKVDSAEVAVLVGYMTGMYPELEELAYPAEPVEDVFDEDSMPDEQ